MLSESSPMVRVVRVVLPAFWPALLFSGVLLLQGCSLLPKKDAGDSAASTPALVSDGGDRAASASTDSEREGKDGKRRDAFSVDVRGPDSVREYLSLHLEIQRYKTLDDLGATEISRLMVAAEANARELLATLGYFTPALTLELHETPASDKAPREIVVTVEPGEITTVSNVQIKALDLSKTNTDA